MNEKQKTFLVPVGEVEEINCLPPYFTSRGWGCYKPEDIKIRWLIGGKLVSTDISFKYIFDQPGVYWVTGKVYNNKYKLLATAIGKVIVRNSGMFAPSDEELIQNIRDTSEEDMKRSILNAVMDFENQYPDEYISGMHLQRKEGKLVDVKVKFTDALYLRYSSG